MSSDASASASKVPAKDTDQTDPTCVLDAMNGSEGLDQALQAEGHPQSRSFSFWKWLLGRS